MDIGQLIFPFIMAVITNSIMIVIIYFLRKIPYFSNLFSVWFMVGLYLLCVLRIFLPIEFPDVQIILRDRYIYSFFVESMAERTDQAMIAPNSVFYAVLIVWAVGFLTALIISLYTQKTKTTYYLANYDFTNEKEKDLFHRISSEVLGDKSSRIVLKKTDAVSSIMVIGYFKTYLLLPNKEYSDDELEMIFRHECTHIKNKDLWLKLLVHIYCCIFWWNPFAYLLKHDLGYTLEMKCDLAASKEMSNEEKKRYFDALTGNCGSARMKNHFFLCAEFSDTAKNKDLIKRTKALASDEPNKVGQIVVDSLIALIFVGVFTASYIIIWQPFYSYTPSTDKYGITDENGYISDEKNSYLVKQKDGDYLFYVDDYPPIPVSKEEVDDGLYSVYPILEK